MTFKRKVLGVGTAALLALSLAACGDDGKEESGSVGDQVNHKITGIDPGAGIMEAAERAIEDYDLEEWTLTSGSDAAMAASLKKAYDKEEAIIVTGWTPHWKFAEYDLKYLDDPEGSFGGEEQINTIGRLGLKDDLPEAYEILSNFNWDEADMAEIMVAIQDGEQEEVAAQNWIDDNAEKVASWVEGIDKVDGDKIKLAYVAWDSEIASHNVMKLVLEDMGFNVTLTQVEAGPMWTAVADGSADATLAAWLPITHETYAEKYEGDFDVLGVSMEGVKIGLVVPEYMKDVNSIEDLKE